MLNAALQGGAARSLRTDNLGKSVAAQLLRMEIEAPASLPRLRPMSAKPRRANNESNRREELLRVSAKLFREKGFDGTSHPRHLDGSRHAFRQSVYHFKTKQDILLAVMEQGLAEGLRKTEAVMALPLPPEQQLVRVIRSHLGTILEDGNDFIPVLLYDWRSLNSENRRRIVALKDRYDALWQKLIDELGPLATCGGRPARPPPAARRRELDWNLVHAGRSPLARSGRRGRGAAVPALNPKGMISSENRCRFSGSCPSRLTSLRPHRG